MRTRAWPTSVLAAADGFAFDGSTDGAAGVDVPLAVTGSHGYLNTETDMRAIFIAAGAGIKPGTKLGVIENLSVAPTIARLLGLEMKDITGKRLRRHSQVAEAPKESNPHPCPSPWSRERGLHFF